MLFSRYVGPHELHLELARRDVALQQNVAAYSLREDSGETFKTSIRYAFRHDTRDSPVIPQRGYAVSSSTELAGVFGVSFVRQEASAQFNVPLNKVRSCCTANPSSFLETLRLALLCALAVLCRLQAIARTSTIVSLSARR